MTIMLNALFLFNIAVLLKKFSGEEGERVDMQKLFGYIGLFTLVALWWLGMSFIVSYIVNVECLLTSVIVVCTKHISMRLEVGHLVD